MKLGIRSTLVCNSVLLAAASVAVAQQTQPSQVPIVVASGNDLRSRLEKGLRITKVGEPVTAKIVQPLYIGEALAVPSGTMIHGHVSAITTASWSARTGRLLDGDLTPTRTAHVTFDQLVFSDGTTVPVHTDTTIGLNQVQVARYLPKSERPGLRQKVKDAAAAPIHEPNKLQRLGQAVVLSLPYHPEYLDQGMIFDATLLEPLELAAQPAQDLHRKAGDNYLHLRLLTSLDSSLTGRGTSIEASVSEPYYDSEHHLLYAAGVKLEGSVTKSTSAAWRKKNGSLLFSFKSIQGPDGANNALRATVAGVEASGAGRLSVNQEGGLRATNSLLKELKAPLALMGPSRALTDSSLTKTAYSRAGDGKKGFGFLGAGAAQASAGAAIGFGYFGAAKGLYGAFIAKGANVELPVNTPIFLRMDDESDFAGAGQSTDQAMLASIQ